MSDLTVTRLEAHNFVPYEELDLVLPTHGLTLVTGANGSGKSSITEAICWALYGFTQRGAVPNTNGTVVRVTLNDGTVIERRRISKAFQLHLTVKGKDSSGQTTTETQAKVAALIGPWERFAPTRLFARDFMSKFAASTDKERKTLLEEILGLERFDIALGLARDELRKHEAAYQLAVMRLLSINESFKRQSEVVSQLGDPTELDTLTGLLATSEAALSDLTAALAQAREDSTAAADVLTGLLKRKSAAETQRQMALRSLAEIAAKTARLSELTECPVCLQVVGPDAHAGISGHMSGLAGPLEAVRNKTTDTLVDLDTQIDEVSGEVELLKQQHQMLSNKGYEYQANVGRYQGAIAAATKQQDARLKAADALAGMEAEILAHITARDTAARVAALAGIAAQTFSLQGARVLLMGQALLVLERSTNQILHELGMGIQVVLKTTSTRRSGKEVDELSVSLIGAGGGTYSAASSGERARVDVALMLGLTSLLGGRGEGLLVFDEVFDTLDEEGIERVAVYLDHMAETRQIIVISHHAELRSLFPRGGVLKAIKGHKGSTLEHG